MEKLSHYGIRGKTNNWFKSYLSNRSMQVKIEGVKSEQAKIEYSVPQGSTLGPLLFIILINELNNVLQYSKSIIFADDTTIYLTGKSPMILYARMKYDLGILSEWFKANKLTLNLKKSNYILFRKPKCKLNPDKCILYCGCTKLRRVSKTKFLGVWIDEYVMERQL